ncbi:hypothetical protein ACR3K2_22080 [Cryptosporidium serpentis]
MIIWDIIYWLYLLILCFSHVYCEDITTKHTATLDSADTQSNIGQLASLLIVYDVDNVLLCKFSNSKAITNPESVPLLAALDERRKLFDKRILPPTIFSHGCGTVAKFMSAMGNKGDIMETTVLNKQGDVFPFEIQIANMGTAYLINDIYFLRSFDGDMDSPLDILKVFFCDEDEIESNISSDIPLNRVLERRYLYSDIVSKVLTKQELPIFQDFMKKTTRDQRIIVSQDVLLSGTNYSQGREYVKKILAKISSLARDWPYVMRNSEVLEVKDMVKYRNYMKDKINLGTTVVLIDDYLYHLNFACMNEHISDKYKILVILVRRFFNKGSPDLGSRGTQKSIPVPIGTLPYEPFRLREVQSKLLHILDIIPPTASPLTFYRALRDEFMFKEPNSPKCGYDVTNPSPFYILIIMDCDMLSHLLKLFIDDRMADEILLLLNIITYISVITNKSCESSCDSSFAMVRHLITSGIYEWVNKIFPLPPIIGYSRRDTDNLFTDKISGSSQSSSNSKESTNSSRILDKHIFMAKFHTRLPRTRTLVLRLDFNGNLSNLQHTDYTCFLNAPTTPSDNIPAYPSRSDKIKQRLNLQFDMKLYKSLVTSNNGEIKAITLLHKIVNVLKGIDEILESTKPSSAKTTFLERSTSSTYSSPSVVPVDESEALIPTSTIEDISFIQILNSKKFTPIHEAPPTIYPPATYTFLSLFYTLIELLKYEFSSDQMFCIGSVNNYIAI